MLWKLLTVSLLSDLWFGQSWALFKVWWATSIFYIGWNGGHCILPEKNLSVPSNPWCWWENGSLCWLLLHFLCFLSNGVPWSWSMPHQNRYVDWMLSYWWKEFLKYRGSVSTLLISKKNFRFRINCRVWGSFRREKACVGEKIWAQTNPRPSWKGLFRTVDQRTFQELSSLPCRYRGTWISTFI